MLDDDEEPENDERAMASSQRARPRRRRARPSRARAAARRLLAAVLVAGATFVTISVLAPPPAPAESVVVLTAARPSGHVLSAADIALRRLPAGFVPEGAMRDLGAARGARLVVGLPAGFPLAPGLVAGGGLVATAPPGTVVVPVRLADPAVTELLNPGDHIDVVQSPADGGAPRVLASGVLVLASAGPADAGPLDLGPSAGPLLLVAASPSAATLLAGAGTWDPLSAVLVPGRT